MTPMVKTSGHPEARSPSSKQTDKQVREQIVKDIFARERHGAGASHQHETQSPKPELIELHTLGKSGAIGYPGGFPRGFTKVVKNELLLTQGEVPKEDILQPFGGGSPEAKELGGDTIDINPDTHPTLVGDSSTHKPYKELLKRRHGKKYKLVVVDPPWGASQSKKYYKTKPISFSKPIDISSKYVEKGGYLVVTDPRKHYPPSGFKREKEIIYDIRIAKSTPRRIQFFRRYK